VSLRVGADEWRAAGLVYRHGPQRLELQGPLRVTLTPQAGR
jgi:hypothetical protein